MKYILLILSIWSVCGSALVAAETPQDTFNRACRLYEDGKYPDALPLFKKISSELKNWKVYCNLGNCYYKQGDFLQAKICYLRARKYKPFSFVINKNIAVVNRQFKDMGALPDTGDFLSRAWQRLQDTLTPIVLAGILLVFSAICNALLIARIVKRWRHWMIYGLASALFMMALSAAGMLYETNQQTEVVHAVVTASNTNMYSGPGEGNTILFKVQPGLEVKILDYSRNWVSVAASAQIAGWIPLSDLETI